MKAVAKYLKVTPRKARLIAGLIKNLPIDRAEAELSFSNRRAALLIRKLLHSAVSNASAKDRDVNQNHLFIKSIIVNEGPMLKRHLPRARGSATPIQKKMSHVTIILGNDKNLKPKFNILKTKPKKNKDKPETRRSKIIKSETNAPKTKSKSETNLVASKNQTRPDGILKRIFRRKSI